MLKYQLLLSVSVILLGGQIRNTQADSNELISFPDQEKPCNCAGLTCNCCQSVVVHPLKMEKSGFSPAVCLQFTLKILPIKLDVKISLDHKTVAEFSVDPKNPPGYCIPMPLPSPVAMCVKLHDIKLVGLTGLQVCSTFYVNFKTDQIFDYKLQCVKFSGNGIDMMSR